MKIRDGLLILVALGAGVSTTGAVSAQDATVPAAEPATAEPAAPSGPEWWIFSRSDQRSYLIDVNSVARAGDEVTVKVARVPRAPAPSDYSHTEDLFGIRCTAREAHVDQSTDVPETGEPTEAYATGEPWETIRPNSLDEGAHLIACENRRPPGPPFASIMAYIDAGRP